MATKAAHKRLTKEYIAMRKEPPPFIWATPDEKNILHWYFIIRGPPDSSYAGGEYFGVILFPSEYPFKPPGIKMLTPSGRFQPDKKICFSMSDFHPGTWNPAWSVATILTGLLSFMLADEMTTGSVTTGDADKRAYAARSHAWNIAQKKFKELFSEYSGPFMKDLPNMAEKERGISNHQPAPLPLTPMSATFSHSSNSPTTPFAPGTPASPRPIGAFVQSPAGGSFTGSGQDAPGIIVPAPHHADAGGDANKSPSWAQIFWEKWRWGVLIALAVMVSRLSTSV